MKPLSACAHSRVSDTNSSDLYAHQPCHVVQRDVKEKVNKRYHVLYFRPFEAGSFCKRLLLTTLLLKLVFSQESYAQKNLFSIVDYSSPLQAQYFEALAMGDTNFIGLLIAASPEADSTDMQKATRRLTALYKSMKPQKLQKKKPKKIMKEVFESVHNELLVKYEYKNQFNEIFKNGRYNCVSATAVYSYMMQRLHLPHVIVEEPTHVYVMTFPQNQNWVLESTSPGEKGFYRITEKDREKQLELLVEQKIITAEERESDQLEAILDSMYPSRPIGLNHLVSLQYTNQSIYDFELENYWEAFQNGLKAYIIEPGAYQKNRLIQGLSYWLDEADMDHPLYFKALGFFVASDSSAEHLALIMDAWYSFSMQYVSGELSEKNYQEQWKHIQGGLKDTSYFKTLNKVYYVARGEKANDERNYELANQWAKKALEIDTSGEDLLKLFFISMMNRARTDGWTNEAMHDSVTYAMQQFPALTDLTTFKEFYPLVKGAYIYDFINKYQYNSAEKELKLMEQIIEKEWVKAASTRDYLAEIYTRMAIHAFNNSRQKALQYINRGKAIVGEHETLQSFKNDYLD